MMNIDEKYENFDTAMKKLIIATCHPFNKFVFFWVLKEYFALMTEFGEKLLDYLHSENYNNNFLLFGEKSSPNFWTVVCYLVCIKDLNHEIWSIL